MPLKSFKGYDRLAAHRRNGGRCACGNEAVAMSCGYPACQRCLAFEKAYYGREEGRHGRMRHMERLAEGANQFSKYWRVYAVGGWSS